LGSENADYDPFKYICPMNATLSLLRNILISFFFLAIIADKGYSQLERATTQIGISVLPIYDIFKIIPNGNIAGVAIEGNLGYLTMKNLSVGINPFYAQVSNIYNNTNTFAFNKERQDNRIYGLNTYIRYYLVSRNKFLGYLIGSVGFGSSEQKNTNLTYLSIISTTDNAVFTYQLGVGINYFMGV
jgi:hypothetical protein